MSNQEMWCQSNLCWTKHQFLIRNKRSGKVALERNKGLKLKTIIMHPKETETTIVVQISVSTDYFFSHLLINLLTICKETIHINCP